MPVSVSVPEFCEICAPPILEEAPETTAPEVTELVVEPSEVTLEVGEKLTLQASVKP